LLLLNGVVIGIVLASSNSVAAHRLLARSRSTLHCSSSPQRLQPVHTLRCVVFVHLFAPVSFNKIVALEDRLDREIVLLVPFVKQTFLNDGKFALQDAQEARVDRGNAYFLAYLEVFVKKYLLSHCPSDVYSAQCHLIIH